MGMGGIVGGGLGAHGWARKQSGLPWRGVFGYRKSEKQLVEPYPKFGYFVHI
jgi:hypothetical protein